MAIIFNGNTNTITTDSSNILIGSNVSISGTAVMSSAFTMRNKIINGAMVIDQRNAGSSISVSSDSGQYAVDRMNVIATGGGIFTAQQSSTAPAGFSTSLKLTVTTSSSPTAGNYYCIRTRLEGYNTAELNWGTANAKTVTLSFWVQASVTGTYSIGITATGSTATYCTSYTISSANTWTQVSITIPGPTIGTWATTNTSSIELFIPIGLGTTYAGTANTWTASAYYMGVTGTANLIATNAATFYITGVQLEIGTAATPFEYRNYQQELAMCQRYYCKTFSLGTAPGNNISSTGSLKGAMRNGSTTEPCANWKFPVSMRTEPTVTLYNPGSGTAGQWSADGAATSSANARSQWISTEGCAIDNTGVAFNNTSNIQAAATAEL